MSNVQNEDAELERSERRAEARDRSAAAETDSGRTSMPADADAVDLWRRLQEERQRREEAEKQRQEEQLRAEEERQRREEAERRAEEEHQRREEAERRAEEERERREEAEKQRQEEQLRAEEERQRREEAERRVVPPIHRMRLPDLGEYRRIGSPSSPAVSTARHPPATLVQRPFGLLELPWREEPSPLDFTRLTTSYSREQTIATLFGELLRCVAPAVFEGGTITFEPEFPMGLKSPRPDLLVMHLTSGNEQRPVGICEVTKPGASESVDVYSPAVLGQAFTYLQILRVLYGVEQPFCILTTWSRTVICWLPDMDTVAASTTLTDLQKVAYTSLEPDLPSIFLSIPNLSSRSERGKEILPSEPVLVASTDRTISVSEQVYTPGDSSTLVQAIGSTLWKMAASPWTRPVTGRLGARHLVVSDSSNSVEFAPLRGFKEISVGPLPRESFKRMFFLLTDLGTGRDGNVWLALTSTGIACVLKFRFVERGSFPDLETREEAVAKASKSAEDEAKCWRVIWNLAAYASLIRGEPTVILPWVKPLDSRTNYPGSEQLIRDAVNRMAAAGYRHDDLSDRHVGLIERENGVEAVFFDLSAVTRVETPEEREAAVATMLDKLSLAPPKNT